jgi:hypothetical protein
MASRIASKTISVRLSGLLPSGFNPLADICETYLILERSSPRVTRLTITKTKFFPSLGLLPYGFTRFDGQGRRGDVRLLVSFTVKRAGDEGG